MIYKKHNILSYKNDRNKIIHAKVIGITNNKDIEDIFLMFGLIYIYQDMYLLKTKNGHYVCKYDSEIIDLIEDNRLEKLIRICG